MDGCRQGGTLSTLGHLKMRRRSLILPPRILKLFDALPIRYCRRTHGWPKGYLVTGRLTTSSQTYKIGKRHKVLCMANLTRHKLPVWVWFRRQRSGLGDVTVTTFRFGCGYGDNVPVWVRLRRRRSGLGAVTVTTFRFGCGCGDNVPRLDVNTAYFRLAVRPVQRGALAISVLPAE